MVDPGFPQSHTTGTTTTTTTRVATNIRFDPTYLNPRNIPGVLKCAVLEFGYCALWTFFYLTAAAACASWGGSDPAAAAAAFFGFVAMILYGADAFFKFKGWRAGEIAQGERQIQMAGPDMASPGAY
ncbi:hypothetical protein Pcinc_030705 [Petrolisthes cinctipes]|uniref:MARVEL domain-containing protein n=1 Tax=Petrolisthes cinctipes TaxID=88211 RepID=A0AAE1EY64_PETCI|nr:hypothetical protein Pcinc_030705 [Petrolisthes cinctipes]